MEGARDAKKVSSAEEPQAKPPLKGEVPAKRAEGFVPHAAKVAAALSAAVTTTKMIGDTPNSQAESTPQKHAP